MKSRFFNKHTITAVLFIISLFIYSILNGLQNADIYNAVFSLKADAKQNEKLWNEYEDKLYLKKQMIEGYGIIQKLLMKHEYNDFDTVKDKQGYLYKGNFYNGFGDDQNLLAAEVRKLNDYVEGYGAKFSFVVTPMKTVPHENAYIGIPYSDFTDIVDDLLRSFRYYNVPYLDLGASLKESTLEYEASFYKTEYHWKMAAVFKGYQDIITWMEEQYSIILDAGWHTRNIQNYSIKIYPDLMLGSQGSDVGKIYASGFEDFEIYFPKNNGDYTVEFGSIDEYEIRRGGFDTVLIDKAINEKVLNTDEYSCYDLAFLYGADGSMKIVNNVNTKAPKILMIGDSNSTPLGCYLAQNFSQVDMLDILNDDKDQILKTIEKNKYDYVIMCIYPENLSFKNIQLIKEGVDD